MKVGIIKPIDGGIIDAVPSVSYIHRALICASLSDMQSYIECGLIPDDISATVKSLNNQGAKIRYDGSGFEIIPIEIPKSGRGFAAAAASQGFAGQSNRGEYWLDGKLAYQSIGGLFFTLPLLSSDSRITVEGREEYKPNIEMSVEMLEKFGVRVECEARDDGGTVYKIPGGQRFTSPGTIKPEGDWTNSAYWMCAAAISGSGVICRDLNRSSRQGDKEIVSILERFGAVTAYKGDSVAVRRSRLRSIRIDAAVTPDIVPVLAAVAAAADGQTVIYNALCVGLHENGILQKISSVLNALGAVVNENPDGLVIEGKPRLRGGTVSSQGDHRIAMMTAVASCVCEDTVAINDAEAVCKSYPDFFDHFEKLGGKITRDGKYS